MTTYKILVIDDAFFIRNLIKKAVMKKPVKDDISFEIVGEAENGSQGLEMVKELNPDIITVDFNIPELNGLDFAKYLKETNPKIPILMVSSNTDPNFPAEVEAIGCHFLQKPFQEAFLWMRLDSLVEEINNFDESSVVSNEMSDDTKELLAEIEMEVEAEIEESSIVIEEKTLPKANETKKVEEAQPQNQQQGSSKKKKKKKNKANGGANANNSLSLLGLEVDDSIVIKKPTITPPKPAVAVEKPQEKKVEPPKAAEVKPVEVKKPSILRDKPDNMMVKPIDTSRTVAVKPIVKPEPKPILKAPEIKTSELVNDEIPIEEDIIIEDEPAMTIDMPDDEDIVIEDDGDIVVEEENPIDDEIIVEDEPDDDIVIEDESPEDEIIMEDDEPIEVSSSSDDEIIIEDDEPAPNKINLDLNKDDDEIVVEDEEPEFVIEDEEPLTAIVDNEEIVIDDDTEPLVIDDNDDIIVVENEDEIVLEDEGENEVEDEEPEDDFIIEEDEPEDDGFDVEIEDIDDLDDLEFSFDGSSSDTEAEAPKERKIGLNIKKEEAPVEDLSHLSPKELTIRSLKENVSYSYQMELSYVLHAMERIKQDEIARMKKENAMIEELSAPIEPEKTNNLGVEAPVLRAEDLTREDEDAEFDKLFAEFNPNMDTSRFVSNKEKLHEMAAEQIADDAPAITQNIVIEPPKDAKVRQLYKHGDQAEDELILPEEKPKKVSIFTKIFNFFTGKKS